MFKSLETEKAKKTLQEATYIWPEDVQALVAVGEMAELQAYLVKKYVQNSDVVTSEIIDEIADAAIMLIQLSLYYGVDNIDYAINNKLIALDKRIADTLISYESTC